MEYVKEMEDISDSLCKRMELLSSAPESRGDSNFRHISNNLSMRLLTTLHLIKEGKTRSRDIQELLDNASGDIDILNEYIVLLERDKDYLRGEMTSPEGYFPEIRKNSISDEDPLARGEYKEGPENYVLNSRRKLRELTEIQI